MVIPLGTVGFVLIPIMRDPCPDLPESAFIYCSKDACLSAIWVIIACACYMVRAVILIIVISLLLTSLIKMANLCHFVTKKFVLLLHLFCVREQYYWPCNLRIYLFVWFLM